MSTITTKQDCIILAGGKGKRMDGRDKGLIQYKNISLIESVIEKVKSQVGNIVISANRNIDQYKQLGYPVVTDSDIKQNNKETTFQGPLAGIAAALPLCNSEWVFVIACDMPLISDTIVSQLENSLNISSSSQSTIAIAEVNKKPQLAMVLNKNLLPSIKRALANNQLKLMQWVNSNNVQAVSFPNENEFKNFNYFKDLA